jgi:hypothetical protein
MRSSGKSLWAPLQKWHPSVRLQALTALLYLGCATLLILMVPCSLHFHRESGLFMRDDGYLWLWNVGADTVAVTTVFFEEIALLLVTVAFAVTYHLLNLEVRGREDDRSARASEVDPKLLVWIPFHNGEPWNGLATPMGSPLASMDAMTRVRFGLYFESRLNRLLLADVDAGRNTLTASSEHSPNLYTIGSYEPPSAWAPLIMQCDQFESCMNNIDWNLGIYEVRRESELPSLGDVIEQL